MILILGGAYQGKLSFAREAFGLTDADIHICDTGEIDFSKRCIYGIEEFTWGHPEEAEAYFRQHRAEWEDSILILRDVFCGVVPMDPEVRLWRQNTGRLSQYFSREAAQVSRFFCGLEQRLK